MELLATYRLQLRNGMDFDGVAELVPYLSELGVTHVYLSPHLTAAPGSTHGYDVIDHRQVDEALGGQAAYERLRDVLRAHGMGQVIDIVPNHMSIATRDNAWWWDVLENGPASRFARYFDVDWAHAPRLSSEDRLLMPILGDHYGRVLEEGHARLAREDGVRFLVRVYTDHFLPLAPESLAGVFARAARRARSDELAFLADGFGALPRPDLDDRELCAKRHRDKTVLYGMLDRLLAREPPVAEAIDAELAAVNQDVDALDRLLDAQHYRLAWWRSARFDLDYRRFFDIDSLAALRQAEPEVFDETHRFVLSLAEDGWVDGIRVDHPDGLYDPKAYFRQLRDAAPGTWIVAEKILVGEETLPDDWPIDGTTGYDFLAAVGGLFTDPAGAAEIEAHFLELTDETVDFETRVVGLKRRVLDELLGADLSRLTGQLLRVCESRRRHRDYTRPGLREILAALVSLFPVYRTYVRAGHEPVSPRDAAFLDRVFARLREERPDLDPELADFIRGLLSGAVPGPMEADFVARFQQLTGPAMAKGVEDTAFYIHTPLLSANEVGAEPSHPSLGVGGFHERMGRAARRWPRSMLAGSTHDTKRSEDVRMRIGLLAEDPAGWRRLVDQLREVAAPHRRGELPDPQAELYIYQTLVGVHPLDDPGRLAGHLEKAMREAKRHTSWVQQNAAYEAAVIGFARDCLDDPGFRSVLDGFLEAHRPSARAASLAQLVLRLTAPGIPDIYQGTELWAESLTDPDNRRPVDFAARRALLDELQARGEDAGPPLPYADDPAGRTKLFAAFRLLQARRAYPDCLGPSGGYEPLAVDGPDADRVVAYARTGQAGRRVVVVAPRRFRVLRERALEASVTVPEGAPLRSVLGGGASLPGAGPIPVGEPLGRFPGMVLVPD